jgi:3-deoxy-manno-octulosonate cytidylyltransferase (CMP-KDO synthetase)
LRYTCQACFNPVSKKILANIKGKPLIEWVYHVASKVSYFDDVVFAIDAEETARCVEGFGGRYYMTSVHCPSGTDRLAELQRKLITADVWVNWQADGPFISEKTIHDLLQSCDKDLSDVWTLKKTL